MLFFLRHSVELQFCLQTNWKMQMACDLNFTVRSEELPKLTGSYIHCKSGNISEMVSDRDDITTWHLQKVICCLPKSHSINCNECTWRSFINCKPFLMRYSVSLCTNCKNFTESCTAWSLCHSIASCWFLQSWENMTPESIKLRLSVVSSAVGAISSSPSSTTLLISVNEVP